MKFIVNTCCLLFLFLGTAGQLAAQAPSQQLEQLRCGTPAGKSQWLKDYQANPAAYQHLVQAKSNTTTYLPLTLHIVGQDDSTGMAGLAAIFSSFCRLNEDFAQTGIQFYIEPPIRYIYDTDFYDHDSVVQGGLKMLQHNVANTINVYFVGSPAGNCGYNLPWAGVAMNNGCLTGHTFAHELGHNLNLPHTFYGWEGGYSYDGVPLQSFSGPAPDSVTINYTSFKDTLYQDTLIIDTIAVENVPRTGPNSNCGTAADGFCDTPADYLAYRWACNGQGMSTVQQFDTDTVGFYSDGWYIMSYALSACQVGFSQEQINAMMANIQSERTNLLYNQNPDRDTVNTALITLQQPAAGATNVPDQNPTFSWSAVPNATHYLIEIYKEPYAANQVTERLIVSDTFYQSSMNYPPRPSQYPYSWRVFPFNYGYTCAGYSMSQSFNTDILFNVNAQELLENSWQMYPNIVSTNQSVRLVTQQPKAVQSQWRIYSSTGQLIWQTSQFLNENRNELEVAIPGSWAAGLYFVEMQLEDGRRSVKKLIVR